MTGLRERLVSLPTAAVLALTVGIAALVGMVGGGTLALWRDVETVSASMPFGVVVFGVRASAPVAQTDYATSATDTVDLTFGPAAAATLYTTGSVALPFQVDALAQGHRGLRYTATRHVTGGVFGDSAVRLVKVASAAACTTDVTGPDASASEPVPAAYSDSRLLTTEHWCLVATFDRVAGAYESKASVSAGITTYGGPAGTLPTVEEGWGTEVLKTFDPAQEPTHRVTFSFTTFRPGQ